MADSLTEDAQTSPARRGQRWGEEATTTSTKPERVAPLAERPLGHGVGDTTGEVVGRQETCEDN